MRPSLPSGPAPAAPRCLGRALPRRLLPFLALAVALGACKSDEDPKTDTAETTSDTTPDTTGDTTGACFQLKDGRCVEHTFANPPRLMPNAQGVYELNLVPGEFMVDGKRHCGRTYNGLFPGPTIETAAQVDGQARQVRVNLRNGFTKHDYRTTSARPCTCKTSSGTSCTPASSHGGHGGGGSQGGEADPANCKCTTDEGDTCHLFDFNTTNLHAHGSHVRPDYATGGGCVETDTHRCRMCEPVDSGNGARNCYFADDVISKVGPGEGVQHRWDIDEDHVHHEGLHWYHPHIHGSTAIQVASGATGAWIVRGPVDEVPGIKNAEERIFLVSTPPTSYTPLADGEPCDEDHITFNTFHTLGDTAEKQTNLINGKRRPRIVMPPSSVERWRFLHGSFLDEMYVAVFRGKDSECAELDFAAGPVPLTQIGRDGITLPRPPGDTDWPFAPPYLFMSPGYRIDTLLDGSDLEDGDTLCVMSARFLQEDTSGTTNQAVGILTPPTPDQLLQALGNGDLITIVNVAESAGTASQTTMPDLGAIAALAPPITLQDGAVDGLEKCAEVAAITDPDAIDQFAAFWMIFVETEGFDECGCRDHNINCKNFEWTNRQRYPYDRVLELGKVDHWRLISGFDGHPFHIHINPFLVCPLPPAGSTHPNAAGRLFEPPFAHWRDTYLVNLARTVDVLTEYRAFTGSFVYHCHKLNHEDHGMMELIRVCDPSKENCGELCDGRPCGWNVCAEGDTECEKQLTGAKCFIDPSSCPEMLVRCKSCEEDSSSCPPESYCDTATEFTDGLQRCVPGCKSDSDCPVTAKCDIGECVPAPPCSPPCGPGSTCQHGACR
ncbi:MAG TPA: multicopper oxidase domain-containing protein [Myxococcota bacterium]|nr:multicopper oxidase domain-containing protein [Myxococcota bacterium]